MKIFETGKLPFMKKALGVYQQQHEAISKNVANASDLNFNRVNTDFSNTLKEAEQNSLKTANSRHIAVANYQDGPFGTKNENDETVDLSQEMGDLAVNQIRFDFVTRVLKGMYGALDASITGRMK